MLGYFFTLFPFVFHFRTNQTDHVAHRTPLTPHSIPYCHTQVIKATKGGSHGVLCLAPSIGAFKSAVGLCRRGGTIVMVGLPKGDLPLNIFDIVIRGITVRGSIVGTRQDLAEALDFAAQGKVNCHVDVHSFKELNEMFDTLRSGNVLGRIVLNVGKD